MADVVPILLAVAFEAQRRGATAAVAEDAALRVHDRIRSYPVGDPGIVRVALEVLAELDLEP